MADTIIKFKPLTENDVYKGMSRTFSTQKTAYGGPADGADQPLQWFMVDRGTADWSTGSTTLRNLFHSFGLTRADTGEWFKVVGASDWYNAKSMLIASIPQSGCGSYIDGSTVELRVPTGTGTTDYDTFYGASYAGYPDPVTNYIVTNDHDSSIFGSASIFLFPDKADIVAAAQPTDSMPYTGLVDGAPNPNSGLTSWTGANTLAATFYPHLKATHRSQADGAGDNPYGIALLDKGLFVIFDMYGRNNYLANTAAISGSADGSYQIWDSAYSAAGAFMPVQSNGSTENTNWANRNGIYFTGSTANSTAKLTYRTITQSYKMIYFCHASQTEFNSTTNHTYDASKAWYKPMDADSIWVTEIGLYDDAEDLMAIAKLSEPVEKNVLETMTFKVELQL